MPLRPSSSPTPGVGIAWPTLPGTIDGWAASGLAAPWTVPAVGVAAAPGAAEAFWAGALAVVCAAAGVSPAAAKAIAHPISLIFTPVSNALGRKREKPRPLIGGLYRRGFSDPQAGGPRCNSGG